eukprot:TRINITY_DN3238_c1_g1_i2.p1 TRINITY_DN3238_c1_g1~~TRINITY_DN3238_c1_g1_i2.p1  ORF type:complete len:1213 (+),score=334.15 TRINITY_DN3238_c1_g1_i2:42-3641(+)
MGNQEGRPLDQHSDSPLNAVHLTSEYQPRSASSSPSLSSPAREQHSSPGPYPSSPAKSPDIKQPPPNTQDVDVAFVKMLDELALPQDKRAVMMALDAERKIMLLANHSKKIEEEKQGKEVEAEEYIAQLRENPSDVTLLTNLRAALSSSRMAWIQHFVDRGGTTDIISTLQHFFIRHIRALHAQGSTEGTHEQEGQRHLDLRAERELLLCIKAMMNTQVGKKSLFDHDALNVVVLGLASSDLHTRILTLDILGVVCLLSPRGHFLVIRALTSFGSATNMPVRFQFLVQSITPSVVASKDEMWHDAEYVAACITFLNAVTNTPEHVAHRQAIRAQLATANIDKALTALKNQYTTAEEDSSTISLPSNDKTRTAQDTIKAQMSLFYEVMHMDQEHVGRLTEGIDFNAPVSIVSAIMWTASPRQEQALLGILRDILLIQKDPYAAKPDSDSDDGQGAGRTDHVSTLWGILEEVASQLVQHQHLLELSGEPKQRGDAGIPHLERDRDRLLMQWIDWYGLLSEEQLRLKVAALHMALEAQEEKHAAYVRTMAVARTAMATPRTYEAIAHAADGTDTIAASPLTLGGSPSVLRAGNQSPFEMFHRAMAPLSVDKPSDEPVGSSTLLDDTQPIPQIATSASHALPPPPPPSSSSYPPSQPTVAPIADDVAPAPSGMAPPPPPPPMMKKAPPMPPLKGKRDDAPARPLGPQPSVKMRTFQWKPLSAHKITSTVWEKLSSDDTAPVAGLGNVDLTQDFSKLEELFCAAPPVSSSTSSSDLLAATEKAKAGKTHQTSLLDGKRSQNIGIMLSRFKSRKIEFADIQHAILTLDETVLDLESVKSLATLAVPTDDELDMLAPYTAPDNGTPPPEDLASLAKPEQFLLCMSGIPRLAGKLVSLAVKLGFPALIGEFEPSIATINLACAQIRNSNKFATLLQVVLKLGNFMNGGTPRGGAYGFRLESMQELAEVRASGDSKTTLLHFLVRLIESKFFKLEDLFAEIDAVSEAQKISLPTLVSEINKVRQNLVVLAKEIEAHKLEQANLQEHDRFLSVMSVFHASAASQFQAVEVQLSEAKSKYEALLEMYGEDPKAVSTSDLFGQVYRARTMLERGLAEVVKADELEARRATRANSTVAAGGLKRAPTALNLKPGSSGAAAGGGGAGESRQDVDGLIAKLRGGDIIRTMRASTTLAPQAVAAALAPASSQDKS